MPIKFRDPNDMPESGLKNFIKLKDGESVAGILMGDVYEFYAVWKDRKPTEVPQGTAGSSFRFRVNLMVKEGAVYTPKVFEQGIKAYKDMATLFKEWPAEETLVKITRHGSSQNDTEYVITPLPQRVPPETLAHLKTIPLNDLSGKSQAGKPGGHFNDDPGPTGDDEIPF